MNSFLQRVAQTYYDRYGADISRYSFVFPNRRAGLFFRHYLTGLTDRPLFSPEIMTISECFLSASEWQPADRLSLLFRLYGLYRELSRSDESFDNFVFWGEMLLNDFDDVDKYGVDAHQLFRNITELKEIDRLFDAFSENQLRAIREFWKNFDPAPTDRTRLDFITTWKVLLPLYERFRQSLAADGLATEGMICRHVADRLSAGETVGAWEGRQFVFVGFNALNPSEHTLFAALQKRGQADFYWDYEADALRDKDNHASYFYAENVHTFKSRFEIEPVVEPLKDKEMTVVAIPSTVGQAKYIHTILRELYPAERPADGWMDTAIVLPDETLLTPLLHSLPEQIGKVNVTMGFPLRVTPVAGLVEHVFELQRRRRTAADGKCSFYFQTVLNLLNHQYVALLAADEVQRLNRDIADNNRIYIEAETLHTHPLLQAIFRPQAEAEAFLPYLMEVIGQLQAGWRLQADTQEDYRMELDFLYQYYITLKRMADVLAARPAGVTLSADTLMRLVRQLTAGISIPFVGEPLAGLQIMGTLETRGLDFDNLIITSFNEGVYPKHSPQNSFIPYNLRRGFNLPTTEHQDALSAYNFYRLIHRARRVFFLYDSRTEGVQTGEISRYAHQLHYHYGVPLQRRSVSFDLSFDTPQRLHIDKNGAVMSKLEAFLTPGKGSKALSASSINSYIDCPLQFYLTRVEELQQADEVKETVEDNMFGTIFHAVMEYTYAPYKGRMVEAADLDRLAADTATIDRHIVRAFAVHYFKKPGDTPVTLEGNNLLIAHIIRKYVLQALLIDKRHAPFRYIASEERCHTTYPIGDGTRRVNLKGFIDRVDEKEGCVRILDYKTGSGSLDFKNFDEVFRPDTDERPKYVLQTFLYGILYREKAPGRVITPGIYYMRDTFRDNFETQLHYKSKEAGIDELITDFTVYEEEFRQHLTACLEEIFDPDTPFTQCADTRPCRYCPYKGVCNR